VHRKGASYAYNPTSVLTETPHLLTLTVYSSLEVFVRTRLSTGLAIILSFALAAGPAMAAPGTSASAPLGIVVQAEHAQLGADATSGGATIYDGDSLQTTWSGSLRANLGGPQMYLRQNTAAQVHSLPKGFSAELTSGTIVVSAKDGQSFELLADGAIIRPTGTESVVAQITRASANELLISSNRGALLVTMGDEVKTVEAGGAYRMEVETDASDPGPQGGGPFHTARNHFIWVAIIAVSAATGFAVWRALVSPSGP
jgi:hypothetical protein